MIQKLDSRKFISGTSEKSPISTPMQGRKRGFITCKILKGEDGGCPHGADGVKLTRNFEFAIYSPERLNSRPTKRIRTCTGKDLPSKQNYQLYIYIYVHTTRCRWSRECQVLPWFSFQFFKLPRDHTFGFYSLRLNRFGDSFEYKRLNMLFI